MLLVHQNTGKENHYRKIFFAVLISTLGRFDGANKKKSVIYTLMTGPEGNSEFCFPRIFVPGNIEIQDAPFIVVKIITGKLLNIK